MSKKGQTTIPDWVMNWSLIIAIVVLLVAFVNYGMSFFYPAPEYQDFCEGTQYTVSAPDELTTESACLEAEGKWTEYDSPRQVSSFRADQIGTTTVSGTCDQDYYCREEFEAADDLHDRNGLIIMLLIGLVVAVLGFLRRPSDVISTAASIAGVIIILSGLARFWDTANDWAQFLLLGSLLIAFIYIAIYRSNHE